MVFLKSPRKGLLNTPGGSWLWIGYAIRGTWELSFAFVTGSAFGKYSVLRIQWTALTPRLSWPVWVPWPGFRCITCRWGRALAESGLPVFGADMEGVSASAFSFPTEGILLMGSESHGIAPELKGSLKGNPEYQAFCKSRSGKSECWSGNGDFTVRAQKAATLYSKVKFTKIPRVFIDSIFPVQGLFGSSSRRSSSVRAKTPRIEGENLKYSR